MPEDDKEFSSSYGVSSLIDENIKVLGFHPIAGDGVNFHLEFISSK